MTGKISAFKNLSRFHPAQSLPLYRFYKPCKQLICIGFFTFSTVFVQAYY